MIKTLLKTNLGRLRIIGILEGISFLLLLGIAMPLKYLAGMPEAVKIVGMAHGVLFMLYVFWVLIVHFEHNWRIGKTLLAMLAAILPFGPFVADARLFRD